MQGGDIASWGGARSIVVMEGLLCVPSYVTTRKRLRTTETLAPPDEWRWSEPAVKALQDKIYRLSMFIDVVTFTSEEIAEGAADWFQRYDIGVSAVEYYDFDTFCRSLSWRGDIQSIYEASPVRIQRYGQRGVAVQGGAF